MGRKRIPWLATRIVSAALGGPPDVPWYLSGGVSAANCIAAYKAIGAASLAASYVNLANPGTYDLTTAAAPTFSSGYGWYFNSVTYLITGINPAANATQGWSFLVRFSEEGGSGGSVIGAQSGGTYFGAAPNRGSVHRYYNDLGDTTSTPGSTSGIIGVAGSQGYFNGIADGVGCVWTGSDFPVLWIGGLDNGGVISLPYTGKIQAVAIYNTILSSGQMGAVTAAMSPLAP